MYEYIIINCIRYFNITNISDIDKMTFNNYILLMRGKRLQLFDEDYKLYKLAFLNRQINLTKQQGKKEIYIYKTMKDFFDYEKEYNKLMGTKEDEFYNLVLKANL